jgi:uncharacterized membrane protein YphA (DoxX/SURF4 family)
MASYGPFITRIGLSGVLLWFGAQQLMSPADWLGFIPEFALSFGMTAETLVRLNGATEVACGALLLLGMYTRIVSVVMGIHLAAIALSLGNTGVAVRDWGLTFAFFGLVFTGPGAFALDRDLSAQ